MTDRYTKAIEQLGSDKLDVRIGGIYALERIARDSAKDHPTVMEVLTAFIREHSHEPWPPPDHRASRSRNDRPGPTSRPPSPWSGAGMQSATSSLIDLAGADLTGANLAARTSAARTSTGADLTGANLTGADLTGANLAGADLTGADLDQRATSPARTSPARTSPARTSPARTSPARTSPARTSPARTSPARTSPAPQVAGRRPVPDGWMVDSDSGRLKRAGQLSEVIGPLPLITSGRRDKRARTWPVTSSCGFWRRVSARHERIGVSLRWWAFGEDAGARVGRRDERMRGVPGSRRWPCSG